MQGPHPVPVLIRILVLPFISTVTYSKMLPSPLGGEGGAQAPGEGVPKYVSELMKYHTWPGIP